MKAILKDKPEAGFRLVDMPVPEIGKDQVLIKVEAAALCRSDVDVYEWTPLVQKANYDLPFVMGHEFAGTIVKVGESVRGYEEGDRVAGETHIPCGWCEQGAGKAPPPRDAGLPASGPPACSAAAGGTMRSR